jgi:NADH dehydrogenase [ubiquinone] 1 alpha subcomplex assembly factor 6
MQQMDGDQPITIADVEQYCEETVSSLLYLQLEALRIKHVDADHIVSHIGMRYCGIAFVCDKRLYSGKATGLMTLIRAIPQHIAAREVNLPSQLLAKHGLSTESVLRASSVRDDETTRRLNDCAFDLASLAVDHLRHAQQLTNNASAASRFVFLAAVPTQLYLDRLQKARFDVFNPMLQTRSLSLYWRLWNANRRETWH